MRTPLANTTRALIWGTLLLSAAGCSHKIDTVFRDNMIPEVRLTQAPVSTQNQYFYAYRMNWVGYDPDGRVDHYVISVDPSRPDSAELTGPHAWTTTIKNEEIIFFRGGQSGLLIGVCARQRLPHLCDRGGGQPGRALQASVALLLLLHRGADRLRRGAVP